MKSCLARAAVATFAAAAISADAFAIIMRHDMADADYIAYAETLPAPDVLLRSPEGASDGMGTWVGDDFILTAAHVAEQFQPGDRIRPAAPVTVKAVHFAPGGPSLEQDIALVEVEPGHGAVVITPICDHPAVPGDRIAVIGAGDTGDGLTGPQDFDGQIRAASNMVDIAEGGLVSFLFDAPETEGSTALEGVSGPGDSGGPAYRLDDGTACIVGVSSGQDDTATGGQPGRYGVREFYADAVHHRSWIDAAMAGGAE